MSLLIPVSFRSSPLPVYPLPLSKLFSLLLLPSRHFQSITASFRVPPDSFYIACPSLRQPFPSMFSPSQSCFLFPSFLPVTPCLSSLLPFASTCLFLSLVPLCFTPSRLSSPTLQAFFSSPPSFPSLSVYYCSPLCPTCLFLSPVSLRFTFSSLSSPTLRAVFSSSPSFPSLSVYHRSLLRPPVSFYLLSLCASILPVYLFPLCKPFSFPLLPSCHFPSITASFRVPPVSFYLLSLSATPLPVPFSSLLPPSISRYRPLSEPGYNFNSGRQQVPRYLAITIMTKRRKGPLHPRP